MDHEAHERAELLHYLAALGAGPGPLERAAMVPLPDLAELVRSAMLGYRVRQTGWVKWFFFLQ